MKRLFSNLKDRMDPSQAGRSTLRSKKEEDDFGFLELAPGENPIVDIVAIHGLDGHRMKTWTAENGTLWLQDLLPGELPNVRVLTYGYDANTRSRKGVSTETIYLHGVALLRDLSAVREDASRRPIIFVAHSLGGIILKQAINICHTQPFDSKESFRDILVSTHAVMFLGTPHSGTNGVELVKLMNSVMSIFLETSETVLKHLKRNSEELYNIQESYISASRKIDAMFFYEAYKTPIIGGVKQLIVPRHSATAPGAAAEVLHADHCQMVKFIGKDNGNFKKVVSYMRKRVEDASKAVAAKWVLEDNHRGVERRGISASPSTVLFTLPPISRNYIERPGIHAMMSQKLLPADKKQHQPRCILHGMGGAGKTQLAANWIRTNVNRFTRVIIVDGSDQAQLEADLERSIRSVGPEYSKMTWKDAVSYLDGKERGWLLFIDNADSPILNLNPYLPSSPHGAVLITTRNKECTEYDPDGAIHVDGLEENEAVNLLHKVANISPTSTNKSLEIVKELGMLALAITQAGAYLLRTHRPLDTYLETFREHRGRILREISFRGTNYPFTTYAAFDMSFDELPRTTQEFMKICAFLNHSLIPVALFKRSIIAGFAAHTVLEAFPPPQSDQATINRLKEILGTSWDEFSFQCMIDAATQASLINVSVGNSGDLFYNVHPLLQTYIKDGPAKDRDEQYMSMTAQLLLGAIRPVEGTNAPHRELLSHINRIPLSVQSTNIPHALAFNEAYVSVGNWGVSQTLLETALRQIHCLSGQTNDESMRVTARLAFTMFRCGHVDKAEQAQREVLNIRLERLGKQHFDTINAMRDLAVTLDSRGQFDEAATMRREVLDFRLKLLGQQHTDTIIAMSDLAVTLRHCGQLEQAEMAEREVLKLSLAILGRKHQSTIMAMNNLALTLTQRGMVDEAEPMRREALDLCLDVFGSRHPFTISTMGNFAHTLRQRGKLDEAEQMDQKVLNLRLNILGSRHPGTIAAMKNLALTLRYRGQLDEAEKLEREVLALRIDILGRHHPATIKAMSNLTITLREQGKHEEVRRMKQETRVGPINST